MPDYLRHVRPGEPLKIPAAAYNAMVDAASAHLRRSAGRDRKQRRGDHGVVTIRNDSGADLTRGHVVGIDAPLYTAADAPASYRDAAEFVGVEPTADHAGNFAVALDSIPAGGVGLALMSGVCTVQLDVVAEADQFADVAPGVTATLKTGGSGAAFIIEKQSGTGTKWARVRLGNAGAGMLVRYGKLQAEWTPGDLTVTLTPCVSISDGTATGAANVTVYIQFPVAKAAPAFGAVLHDILGYVEFPDGAGGTARMLFAPPILPRPTGIHEVLQNASADTDAPHIVSQYPQGHA